MLKKKYFAILLISFWSLKIVKNQLSQFATQYVDMSGNDTNNAQWEI